MDITSATVMIMETHVFCGSLFVEEELKMKMPDSEYNSLKQLISNWNGTKEELATVYKGNIIKNLIMDCQSYTKYRPNETTGGIFVSWRRKEELPTGA